MRRRSGSVLLLILAAGLVLLTLGLLFSYYFARNVQRENDYVIGAQLRTGVYGSMRELMESDPDTEMQTTQDMGVLYPSQRTMTLTKQVLFSTEKNFRVCRVGAHAGDKQFVMVQHAFIPNAKVQERAGNEVFTASNDFKTNTIKNMNGASSSSGVRFAVPEKLENYCWSVDSSAIAEFKRVGFSRKIYYVKGDFSFPAGTYSGDGMFIVDGNLTFAARSIFNGRTIFLVSGNTTISSNVTMDDVFILSEGSIGISSGCNLTGHFRTNMGVNINGKGTFATRTDAGRPFYSVAYVWD